MFHDSPLAVPYPTVSRKKVTAAFDGGRLSSDSGVMLLSLAERRRGLAKILADLIADRRAPSHVTHTACMQQAQVDGALLETLVEKLPGDGSVALNR